VTAIAARSGQPLSTAIAAGAIVAIGLHIALRVAEANTFATLLPLYAVLIFGGIPLTYELVIKAAHRQFGSDLLAGISIVTSAVLGEYLAGSIVVLMLAGGEALESYALRTASSVLEALAKRMPSIGHRKEGVQIIDVPLDAIAIGDVPAHPSSRNLPG
jgi:cation transport ATPase